MKESDHVCCGCNHMELFDGGFDEGYRVALERISNLRDIEKTQQRLEDMTQHRDGILELLKWLVQLHGGVGRDGAPSTMAEWEDAWSEAVDLVASEEHKPKWQKPKSVSDRKTV